MAHRKPAEAFPPGEVLLDELNARGWTQIEFAEIIGRPYPTVNEIVNGRKRITPETAKELSAALGTSPEFWMNLETSYRLAQAEEASPKISTWALMRSKFPLRDMFLRNWIIKSDSPEVVKAQLFRYFEIESLQETPRLANRATARRSNDEDDDLSPSQIAWLYRVKHISSVMNVPAYSEKKLRDGLETLSSYREYPEELRQVSKLLEDCGVRFVIVEPLPSSKIDGVCFWLDKSPVIGMSLRYDRIDNFWFVLRHEIEHVLNGDGKETAIVDSDIMESQDTDDLTEQERNANEAAAEFCIPQAQLKNFIERKAPYISKQDVETFSKRIRVHPGLVVGQLQWQIKRFDLFRNYLISIRDYIVDVSMTDGYGKQVPIQI